MVVDEKLLKWLQKEIAAITGDPVSRVELFHTTDGQGERCKFWTLTEGMNIQELAQDIWDMAENDAGNRTLGMPNLYVVWAFHGDSQEPTSRFPFTLRGRLQGSMLDGMESSDSPTDRGERAQQMRMIENQHRLIMLMADSTAGRLVGELDRERTRREKAEERAIAVSEQREELLDQKDERALLRAKEEGKERRFDEFMGFLMSMAPMILAKFVAGDKPILGTNAGVGRDAAIAKLLKNLSNEEGMNVINSLKTQNQLAFMELYQSYKEDDAKDQAKKPILFRDREHRLLKPVDGGKK